MAEVTASGDGDQHFGFQCDGVRQRSHRWQKIVILVTPPSTGPDAGDYGPTFMSTRPIR